LKNSNEAKQSKNYIGELDKNYIYGNFFENKNPPKSRGV